MPVQPIPLDGGIPLFTSSYSGGGSATPAPVPTSSRAWSVGNSVVVLPINSVPTKSTAYVGDILSSQVTLDFDPLNDEYLPVYGSKATQDQGMLIDLNEGRIGVPSNIRVFDPRLEEEVFELLPPLPPDPPFAPPVFRQKPTFGVPIGIKWYNTQQGDQGRAQAFDQVVAQEESNVLFVADAYNYLDENGNEIEEGLKYQWRVNNRLTSDKKYLYLPNVERRDIDGYSQNGYEISLEVSNEIGVVYNSVELLVWGGENGNEPIDLEPPIPFQNEFGFYWFWDESQDRLVKVFNDGTATDANGNPIGNINPDAGITPVKVPSLKITTNSGDTLEYNIDSPDIKGVLRRSRYIEVLPRTLVGIYGRKNYKGGNYYFFNYSSNRIYKIELPVSKRDIKSLKVRYFDDFTSYLDLSQVPVIQLPTNKTRVNFDSADILHHFGADPGPSDSKLVSDLRRFDT